MDATLCNVIYVDRAIRQDRIHRAQPGSITDGPIHTIQGDNELVPAWESRTLEANVDLLANVFGDVHLCSTGNTCIAKLFYLQDESMLDLRPTIVLIDIPYDEHIPPEDTTRPESRSPSPHSSPQDTEAVPNSPPSDDVYGVQLLKRIVSEAHLRNLSKLIVPVPVIGLPAISTEEQSQVTYVTSQTPTNRPLLKRCLKLGATDVLCSPIHPQSITSLEIHAYWAHKSAAHDQQALMEFQRGRKRSWVGVSDARPYAYLRETMVATLMRRICQMEEATELPVEAVRITVAGHRKPVIAAAIGNWHFSAHDFTDDELIEASVLMFKHALAMPEMAEFRIPTDQLVCFLIACRAAYNSFVPYHNFRHVVDVLQATFSFLLHIGALPPYQSPVAGKKLIIDAPRKSKSPMEGLLKPFEALTLLITAIGHDVGHPGVNNGFLIVLNAPLAQLYNDRSVLESFHCAAYSQILRRYWPVAFANTKMRNLMISSILATDMGLHFDYMKKLGNTQEKLAETNGTDGWDGRTLDEQTALACALLIKCADISNVARRHDTAIKWMHILSDEFSRQAYMEGQLEIKSSLAAPPKKDIISLFRSQLGFMNLFAVPLFQGVASVLPSMQYCVDELELNKTLFEQGIAEELAEDKPPAQLDGSPPPDPTSAARDLGLGAKGSPSVPAGSAAGTMSGSTPNMSSSKEDSGPTSQFDSVAEFAASDPFHTNDGRALASTKQRVSEATDGSTSIPSGGDWASQATSATTGKMPLSPSTQGTSIISTGSLDRPPSMPTGAMSTANHVDSIKNPSDSIVTAQLSGEDGSSLSSGGHGNGSSKMLPGDRTLKKKTSRFRMNAITFLRRHLSQSPPMPTSSPDTTATNQ